MLETAEAAEAGYKKREKKPAPQGVAAFNAKTLFEAYDRRTANVPTTLEEYEKLKQTMPEFYRAGDSLLYGVRHSTSAPTPEVTHAAAFWIPGS